MKRNFSEVSGSESANLPNPPSERGAAEPEGNSSSDEGAAALAGAFACTAFTCTAAHLPLNSSCQAYSLSSRARPTHHASRRQSLWQT